ncbi:MAG: hypothetical protein ACXACB_04080 [Promethearchaeota archaeon]
MEKTKLLFIPLFVGLILMACSWFYSYPLSIETVDDFVFYQMSVLYWFSLSLLLGSMFSIAIFFKNNYLKWIMCLGVVATLYSTSIFYSMMPGSDSQFFRGLTEYYIETGSLDSLVPNHSYYQWPSFFLIFKVITSISGLTITTFEYILYAIIGFLLTTSLYIYVSRKYQKGAIFAVAGFFVSMFLFLNFQAVPFSLALGLLFLLFMVDTQKESSSSIITVLILFIAISITHSFVPVFFILYLLIYSVLERKRKSKGLVFYSMVLFLLVQITLSGFSLQKFIRIALTWTSELSSIADVTFVAVSTPLIDNIAQFFSRTVTISFVLLCGFGFLILIFKRKLGKRNVAIFFTGAFYFGLGTLLYLLGSRAIPIAFIPFSIGLAFLFEWNPKRYFKHVFSLVIVILLILFLFIRIHQLFGYSLQFQTQESYNSENFFLKNYNWEEPSIIFADLRATTYLQSKLGVNYPYFNSYWSTLEKADTIFYTIGLGKYFINWNATLETILYEEDMNLIYDNSISYIALRINE